ncbi:MAG TPA: allophanate hydrolase [Caulobacteraceae bacterium]|nr:allophanate hydrolase [Caulobacteraceae bacterium]
MPSDAAPEPVFSRLSLLEIATAVREGRSTAREVVGLTLARIAAYEGVQPAVWITHVDPSAVVEAAASVDARTSAGEDLPLAGVPFAVKDNLDVAGLPTTAGCPAFAYMPETTAPVVQRLIDAGAILMGKANLDQFATGLVGARSPYGALGCVFDRNFISGGSSSGSAVAVAAGLVAFALGTDTAGSGRVPAAFNNLVGLKPTPGRWSTRGLVPACRSLDCVTVFANDTADAAAVDAVAAGFDPADPYSRRAPARPATPATAPVVGLPAAAFLGRLDPEARALFEAATSRLAATGARLIEVDIGFLLDTAALLYQGPWVAERTAAVEALLRAQPSAIHPVVRQILESGWRYSALDAFRGQYELAVRRREAEAMWASIDVLALPTTTDRFRIVEVEAEPIALNAQLGRFTNFVNLLDMSAIAAPAGFRADRTGFGVTLIGPAFADAALIELARAYEEAAPMPDAPPLDVHGVVETVRLAVVGAHLAAMPLHWQLSSRRARLVRRGRTSSAYRLYAMTSTTPAKPALIHVGAGGAHIEVEVYELEIAAFGSFVAAVPPPLAIGTVELDDGSQVKGFVAEPRAIEGAEDITGLGGWRAYVAREAAI